jgi:hypothetical protein
MAVGLWLHLTERQAHPRRNGTLQHNHQHFPDIHHRHDYP